MTKTSGSITATATPTPTQPPTDLNTTVYHLCTFSCNGIPGRPITSTTCAESCQYTTTLGTGPPTTIQATTLTNPNIPNSQPTCSFSPVVVGTQVPWGQCGGQGYQGPTGCPAGFTCVADNVYYSQCLE
ncbi:hypothetical protein SISSUDRAFT_1059080 [Sistotremastrum suecicum HHB10207 ss-3]|uniref:CBM1 domain-containing protein n=1 Tax=Sistotremastrum suecicum HHB10207 ss-3 TaxID=1314776 RepID=A0A166GK94_9AGAM|nr:hypothetical protein SISSUDRAFT_1059080 [Sistotremastrum suecicum HHB10207 ss-3]